METTSTRSIVPSTVDGPSSEQNSGSGVSVGEYVGDGDAIGDATGGTVGDAIGNGVADGDDDGDAIGDDLGDATGVWAWTCSQRAATNRANRRDICAYLRAFIIITSFPRPTLRPNTLNGLTGQCLDDMRPFYPS